MAFRRTLEALLAATVVGAVLFIGSAAGAVDNPDYTAPPPSSVPSTTPTSTQPQQARRVETAVSVTPVRSRLAITGSDVGQLAVIGSGLVLAGGVVLVLRRRRPLTA